MGKLMLNDRPYSGGWYKVPVIYSTSERQIGVWIDGKPLYQKSIQTTITTNRNMGNDQYQGDVSLSSYISNPEHIFFDGENSYYLDSSNNQKGFLYGYGQPSDNSVGVCTLYARSNVSAVITVTYTKTTDTAGSGIYTPGGEYSHHYSTTEKIVGTWIDGKPIYEVSYERTTAMSSGQTTISNLMTNCETVVELSVYLHHTTNNSPIWTVLPIDDSNGVAYTYGDTVYISISSSYANNRANSGCLVVIRYTKSTD